MNNYSVLEVENGVPIFMWDKSVPFENAAVEQLKNLARHPFVYHHIAAMPDTHAGIGSTVGSVFATSGAVIPAAVGVDIGCGMIATKTSLFKANIYDVRDVIRKEIEARIPMGRTANGRRGDRGAWGIVPTHIQNKYTEELSERFSVIANKHPELYKANIASHLGTLGTGNHFVEVQFDTRYIGEEENYSPIWIMLHSGSRGVGNKIGTYFTQKAKTLMERYHVQLPDKDLAYIPEGEDLYNDYIQALHWAQDFALLSRQIMMDQALEALRSIFPYTEVVHTINTHHNYAAIENHYGKSVLLTRKGAIRAREGDQGIIPGSMGTKSYIVEGLGNPASFNSCSHGAGRVMSRTAAKKRFTLEDHAKAMEGVVGRLDADVIDETPLAYKDIDHVIEAETDLVKPTITLKQLLVCKG